LQEKYGKFVHRIVTANFPDWARAVPMPGLDNRVRVGYVSAFFRNHSVSKTHLGWLREHNGSEFDVYAYYLGEKMDAVTAELHGCTKRFQHSLNSITDVCRAIRSDNLHVLVFLDLGMKPVMTQAASLRLAPIQCSTWGHPVTSGLPTVDYFLSSALMEPRNAHCHYTERLVTLPGVGICYRKPIIPKVLLRKSRHDYGLRTDAIVYLSCQSLFKYLPEDDGIFPAIAKQIPEAQFVFLTPNDYLLRDFRWRLERAFSAVGLSVRDHCVFLPEQDTFSYWNLNLLADVYLDTMQWSGCNTTLEALACGLPVVTLPGKFMRGRHSYAILTQLRVTDTIAHDKADYIDIAARLGRNPEWRVFLAQRVNDGYFRLYSDVSSVSALEEFYKQMVKENRTVVEANTPAAV
jgi:predicted O-linked N-acetylglucosamine transferase (SPINDLY family)